MPTLPMPRLLVLRHAKSDWTTGAGHDFDRPLNARGRASAPLIGAHMAAHGLRPDRILCSPALRTRETLELVLPHLGAAGTVELLRALYDDSEADYLDIMRREAADARCLLVIGHNPACQETVLALAGSAEPELADAARRKYPTATLAVLDLAIPDWSALAPGCGRLVGLAQPRRLPSATLSAVAAGG